MSDDDLAKLTYPELVLLAKQILDEMELRAMAMICDSEPDK